MSGEQPIAKNADLPRLHQKSASFGLVTRHHGDRASLDLRRLSLDPDTGTRWEATGTDAGDTLQRPLRPLPVGSSVP